MVCYPLRVEKPIFIPRYSSFILDFQLSWSNSEENIGPYTYLQHVDTFWTDYLEFLSRKCLIRREYDTMLFPLFGWLDFALSLQQEEVCSK